MHLLGKVPKAYFISYISDCSSSSLYVEFKQKKYSGEDVSNLGDQDWWSRCSKSIREEAYSWIQEDRIDEEEKLIRDARTVTQAEQRLREQLENEKALRELILQNNDPTNCDRYGYAQYNALTEKCECKGSYVMIDNKCVTPPYCGDSATYSENSGECECNTGYKKVGKNCEYVSCTANSAYNPKTGNCECFSGYLVRNSQCKSSIELCGISGKYYTATGDCSECGYGEYLKGRDCVREPYCGVGSNFNPITEKCVCESGYLVKDGRCVSKYSYCDSRERYNDSTKKCECYSPYIRINGKCDRDYSWITE